jgi:hypothetical protein
MKGGMKTLKKFKKMMLSRTKAIAISIMILSACNNAPPIGVNELLKNATIHNGQMVTLKGCYSTEFETTILHSCVDPKWEETIWVLPFSMIGNSSKMIPGYAHNYRKMEKKLSAEEEHLIKQFSQLECGSSIDVILRGEFHSSSKPLFGSDAAYKYELILHRVLSISPRNNDEVGPK